MRTDAHPSALTRPQPDTMRQSTLTRGSRADVAQPAVADAPTEELVALAATECGDGSDRSLAADRLALLGALLEAWGVANHVVEVPGDGVHTPTLWPVLYVMTSHGPWVLSAGPVNFWRSDPVAVLAPNKRAVEAAWIVAALVGGRR